MKHWNWMAETGTEGEADGLRLLQVLRVGLQRPEERQKMVCDCSRIRVSRAWFVVVLQFVIQGHASPNWPFM